MIKEFEGKSTKQAEEEEITARVLCNIQIAKLSLLEVTRSIKHIFYTELFLGDLTTNGLVALEKRLEEYVELLSGHTGESCKNISLAYKIFITYSLFEEISSKEDLASPSNDRLLTRFEDAIADKKNEQKLKNMFSLLVKMTQEGDIHAAKANLVTAVADLVEVAPSKAKTMLYLFVHRMFFDMENRFAAANK